jgi:hypothetical protein
MMRQNTSELKFGARPHINEAIVKMTIDATKYCRRPKRAASHGVIGITTTLAMIYPVTIHAP